MSITGIETIEKLEIENMAEKQQTQTQLTVIEEEQIEGDIELTIRVKVRLPKTSQGPQLPAQLEESVEQSGLTYKKTLYQWLIEAADKELVASKEKVEQLTRHEKKPFIFKTIFGSVAVKRTRVKYPNGRTETPSANKWQTEKVSITRGLRAAVCRLMVKMSISQTEKEISQRTGENDLLSDRTILNILHDEGEAITGAVEQRARRVYEEMPEAKCLRIASSKPWRKKYRPLIDDESWESDYEYEETIGARVIWYWEAGKLTLNTPQRTLAEGLVVVQCDECVVKAQSKTAGKDVWVYTAVVNASVSPCGLQRPSERAYYFTCESGAKLFFQIGALLALLDVHKGSRDILVLGDGAKWIRK